MRKQEVSTTSSTHHNERTIQKNKLDFGKVKLRRRSLRDLKANPEKPIHALDTETLQGYARLLTDDTGAYRLSERIEDYLSFLTQAKFRDSHNFFYNIQYDFDAIMKYLPVEDLKTLVFTQKLTYGAYEISYIPKKMFTVKLGKQPYRFFDLAQFYEMSLEKAAKLYVNGVKNEDNLSRELIGTSPEYWEENLSLIVKYCIQDSFLTMRLGEVLQAEIIDTAGFCPKQFISKAGLSKEYFRRECSIPDMSRFDKTILYYAFNAYHGGRFEVTERGLIGECQPIDINSAYPYQISKLIDCTKGIWKRTRELHDEAYYGFYLARVNVPYMQLPPLAFNYLNTVIYPCGQWTAFFTKEELEVLGKIGSYEVVLGFEYFPDVIVYPFKEAIEKLYYKKSITSKKDFKYALYKKIMNSFYGSMYEKIKQPDGTYKAGLLFNPIYATLITANTRLQIWEKAQEFGSQAVSLATDGLLLKGSYELEDTKDLGAWGVEEPGEACILRSGIYSVGDEFKQRGVMKDKYFRTPYGEYENLFDYIRQYPDFKKYPVLNKRPWHMSECIRQCNTHSKEDINVFEASEVAFDLNTEVKRVFEVQDITGKELLNMNIKSKPHLIMSEEI